MSLTDVWAWLINADLLIGVGWLMEWGMNIFGIILFLLLVGVGLTNWSTWRGDR